MEISDEKLIGYVEGELPGDLRKKVEQALEESQELRNRLEELKVLYGLFETARTYDPNPTIDVAFQAALAEEMRRPGAEGSKEGASWLRIAAAVALLVTGFAGGSLLSPATSGSDQFAQLQGQVADLQQMVMMNTLRDHSASERLQVVNMIEDSSVQPNEKLVATLVRTVTEDDSPNVRYAAVQALQRFMTAESVRMEMVRALARQTDPLIQIAMINMLVEAEEKAAIAPMKKLIEKQSTTDEVRRQAKIAMDILI